MKIQKIIDQQFKQIFAFNKQIFPARADAAAHFRFLFVDNPLVTDKSRPNGLIACNEQDEIIGQFMLCPAEFIYRGQKKICYWGCDYYVVETHRHSGAGALLAMQAINGYKPYFTIGASSDAMKISLALKTRYIGDLYKFIHLNNVFTPFKAVVQKINRHSAGRKIAALSFPDAVQAGECIFKRFYEPFDWPEEHNSNDAYLEFSRSRQFIEWRFCTQPDIYYVYQAQQFPGYLVCRALNWHGLQLLALVDYRASLTNEQEFTAILKAAAEIAAGAGLDGMMIMSSLAFFDRLLLKKGFIRIGRPQPIITNAAIDLIQNEIDTRNTIYATMADCDIDLNL